jgi:hypothetical protein
LNITPPATMLPLVAETSVSAVAATGTFFTGSAESSSSHAASQPALRSRRSWRMRLASSDRSAMFWSSAMSGSATASAGTLSVNFFANAIAFSVAPRGSNENAPAFTCTRWPRIS